MKRSDVDEIFYKVHNNQIKINEFEDWLYEIDEDEFEKIFDKEFYFDIININYKDKFAKNCLESIINNKIPFRYFETMKIRKLLINVIENTGDLFDVIDHTYLLYCRGYDFLRKLGLLFVFYGLDDFENTEKLVCEEKSKPKNRLESLLPEAKLEAKRLLNFFNNGEIHIIGKFEYVDSRKEIDKIENN